MATVRVGDRIEVESEKVGSPTRVGLVLQAEGGQLRVRWDSGRESWFFPSVLRLRFVR
jgi:hypothetical protein